MRSALVAVWRGPVSGLAAERWVRTAVPLLYMFGIYSVSAVPGEDVPHVVNDKFGHFAAYYGLCMLVAAALAGFRTPAALAARVGAAFSLTSLYGLSDEWHQSFVPGRYSSWGDVVADIAGAAAAALTIALLFWWSGENR